MKNEIRPIKMAIMGAGTVGGGVYKLLQMRKNEMMQRAGTDIEISKILVKSISETRKDVDASLLTENFEDIINDDSIQIVVEVMGGIEPARTFIRRCLNAGKSVVSANKDLIAVHGRELLDAAKENNVDFMFEASCAGGIPIIRSLKQSLVANDITEIMGIVNGTTNYILTKMDQEGMEFDEALAKATELGYAEADPTADIEGLDAGRKMAIMGSIGFHSRIVFDDVYTEGITHITSKDIKYAKDMDCVIKLLGIARNTPTGIEVRVHPTLINKEHPMASVNDVFNAVFVHGDAVDDTMFYGRGAGEMPTASAVVGDVIEVARNINGGCLGRFSCTCFKELPIKSIGDIESKYFMRMIVSDCAGVLGNVASILGNNHVSIEKIIQKPAGCDKAEIVAITDSVQEKNFKAALQTLNDMSFVQEISSMIRVYA
ncbi:homoserine dehydrogenase [Frisingicoccus sp.]|uniref:homoserine dehydrogenase n=1 Tax=Frisingicoccus sp. TaxID=1918627 RepID=UPI002E7AA5CA|nr:homoserine dehydrogenase [Frisingicoccus sp.]MEE0751533.1 homoserine dehydrogenase [Frisingicoccus sp.]